MGSENGDAANHFAENSHVTAKKFYDWQTSGGTDDVMRLVDCLERSDIPWCATGGLAVNHWADEPMVTQDVEFVVASGDGERAVEAAAVAQGLSFNLETAIEPAKHAKHTKNEGIAMHTACTQRSPDR